MRMIFQTAFRRLVPNHRQSPVQKTQSRKNPTAAFVRRPDFPNFPNTFVPLSMPVRAVRRVWPPLCRNSYWRGLLRYGAGKRYPAPVPTRSNAYLPLPGNVRAEPSAQNNVWRTKRTNRFSTANVPLPHVPMPSRRKWMCRVPPRPSKPATAVWRDSKYKPSHSFPP